MQRHDARALRSGRCRLCGHVFLWMKRGEYNHEVAVHVSSHGVGIDPSEAIEKL